MKKNMILINVIVVFGLIWGAMGFSGCSKKTEPTSPEVTEVKEVGTFIKSTNVPTSFNESVKSNVETTNGSFTVRGSVSGIKGDTVVIKKNSNIWYLYIGNSDKKREVLGM